MANIEFNTYTPPPRTNQEAYTITIPIFFEGTKNNKNNSDTRNKNNTNHKSFQKHGKDSESSYQNDWSNVARLWDVCSDKANRIYIEGIGTTNYRSDSKKSYALGSGSTGIRFKVRKGCEESAKRIKNLMNENKGKILKKIVFNVYGFSRGAAAARNFVYEIGKSAYKAKTYNVRGIVSYADADDLKVTEKELPTGGHFGLAMKQNGLNLNRNLVEVNFLGVFDTVSSYATASTNFSNDVGELNLNSLGKAKHVVHLTARDEIRENFSLTRLPNGIEKDLPGVHSDIGGSYLTGSEIIEEIETSWTTNARLFPYRDRLIEQGWYKQGELTITGGTAYWALRGEKSRVYKEYSFIPLHFIADFSDTYEGLIESAIAKSKYSINSHELLVRVKKELQNYVNNGGAYPYAGKSLTRDRLADLKALRYGYFHRSARREGIGMDPNNDWKRKELDPNGGYK